MARRLLSQVVVLAVSLTAIAVTVVPARAQQSEGTKTPVAHRQVISANPFGLMFKWWNVEFERKITSSTTWGVSGSSLSIDDARVLSVSGLCRYYPQKAALTGVYLGGRASYYRGWDSSDSGGAFGLGFEVGYTWLVGSRRNIGFSLGAGVTRLFGGDLGVSTVAVPTLRLMNVGIAF